MKSEVQLSDVSVAKDANITVTTNKETTKAADSAPKTPEVAKAVAITPNQPKKPLKKEKDRVAIRQQNKLLLGFFAEQWFILLFGFPFMFLGSITDFFFPNFIGKAINAMKSGS